VCPKYPIFFHQNPAKSWAWLDFHHQVEMWWWMESVWELEMVDTLSITLMSSLPRETDTPVSGTGKTMGKTISHLRRHPIVKPSYRMLSVGEVFLDISGRYT